MQLDAVGVSILLIGGIGLLAWSLRVAANACGITTKSKKAQRIEDIRIRHAARVLDGS